jgi:hypothetical protein
LKEEKFLKPELRRHVYASEVEEPTYQITTNKPSLLFTPQKNTDSCLLQI